MASMRTLAILMMTGDEDDDDDDDEDDLRRWQVSILLGWRGLGWPGRVTVVDERQPGRQG